MHTGKARRAWMPGGRTVAIAAAASLALIGFYLSPAGLLLRSRTRWFVEDPWGGARPLLWRDMDPKHSTASFPHYESVALARAYPDFAHESPHNIFLDALVIEPPAGADLRAAMAVSPIYLESLKTYEHFADSDSLFQKAVRQFGLQGRPIESLKRRVLRVQLVRNTRILEISATLPDPQKAQALAKFLAESTVETNRASVAEGDQDLLRGIEQQARELRARLQETDANWARAVAGEPLVSLQASVEQAAELRVKDRGAGAERRIGDCRPRRPREDGRRRRRTAQAGNAMPARGWRRFASRCRSWTGAPPNGRSC